MGDSHLLSLFDILCQCFLSLLYISLIFVSLRLVKTETSGCLRHTFWNYFLTNFPVLSETTRRSLHEHTIMSFLDYKCAFSFS